MDLRDKRVLVTGGNGFLGRVLIELLEKEGCEKIYAPRKLGHDFTHLYDCQYIMESYGPHVVIHSAAYYGGIWINKMYPADIFYQNLVMGAHLIKTASDVGVEKFVGVGTACSYPGYLEGELKEEDFWSGPVHRSVRNYGGVKKMMQMQCEAYKDQYDFNGIHVMLANLYGEWDSYNPERSHVVAALIRKFVEAKKDNGEVIVWGSGKPIREFLHVRDAAEGIIRATKMYDSTDPLNIGTGQGTSIRELVEHISEIVGFDLDEIVMDSSKPDGQYKKIFDVTKMKASLQWEPNIPLHEGLVKTIKWFEENYEMAIARW